MTGFMFYSKGDTSKEEMLKNLDVAIVKARAEMETSILLNGREADETVKLSQRLDPLIAHKQRMMLYESQM